MKFKFYIIIVLIFLSSSLMACSNNYKFTEVEEINLYEPMDLNHTLIVFNPIKTSLKNCELYFDSSISEKDRISYVKFVEEMLNKIDSTKKFTYYISDKFSNRVTNKIIYLKYSESYENPIFLCFTLQYIYGVNVNYGLLYGYSNYLMGNKNTLNTEELKYLQNDEIYVFDLTLPVFMDEYTPSNIIELAKKVSVNLVRYIINTKGKKYLLELINQSSKFDIEFESILTIIEKEWLNSLNINIKPKNLEIVIRYSNVSYFYPLKLETNWMEYYFQDGFIEKQDPIFPIRIANFKELRDFMVITESEMSQVRDFVGEDYSIIKYGKLPIYYVPDYYNDANKQRVTNSTLHEYVHFITSYSTYSTVRDSFSIEGLATYLDGIYNPITAEFNKKAFENYVLTGDVSLDQIFYNYNQYMFDNNKEYNQFDFYDYVNYYKYLNSSINANPYIQGASYVNYIVNTYGKEKYMEYYAASNYIKNINGKKEDQLIEEWKQYLKDKFAKI